MLTMAALGFLVVTVAIVVLGVVAAARAKDGDEDYFLAGRTLGPWVAALSAAASGSSAWVTMGLVGIGFDKGVVAYWMIPGVLFGIAFNWLFLAKRMRARSVELGAITVPDLFAMHFRERLPVLRLLSVAVILVAMLLYVSSQLAGAGKAFSMSFDGIGYHTGLVVSVVLVLAYSVFGGFRAACWTDFVQALVMVAVLVGMPIALLSVVGGWSEALATLQAVDAVGDKPSGEQLVSFWPQASGFGLLGFLLGAGGLGINFGYAGQPHVVVRFMALSEKSSVVAGGAIQTGWTILAYGGAVTIGLLARAAIEGGATFYDPGVDESELVLLLAARDLLPGVVAGLVLAGVLAAIASTADSQLVVAASAVANDGYRRIVSGNRPSTSAWLNRGTVLVLGIVSALLVLSPTMTIYTYVLDYGWAILGAAFGPQMILLLLWRRANYAGCVVGMATGFVVPIVWKLAAVQRVLENTWFEGAYNLTVAFIAALVLNVVVSLIVPSRRDP